MELERDSLRETLQKSPLFSSITDNEIKYLNPACKRRVLKTDETLFNIGSESDHIFVILKGLINIRVPSQDGDVIIARLKPGEVMGEMGIGGELRTATATAAKPSEMLLIHRNDFNKFLDQFPRYNRILLAIATNRLRHTNLMVSEMINVDSGVVLQPDTMVAPGFQTTICGYGRYGKNYIGPKYAKAGYPWEVVAVVDPIITPGTFKVSVLGRKRSEMLIFNNFDDWYNEYFIHLSEEQQAKQVVEIPLKPELLFEQAMLYINAGVKQFVLPKPVVMNQQQLADLIRVTTKKQIKGAVASQWHYSDFPIIIQREIRFLAYERGNAPVHRVEVEFSKENGLAYATPPPLLELPHVLQLLESSGLVDMAQHQPEIKGTDMMVDLVYRPTNIIDGVYVRTSIDYHPSALNKRKYPDWDYQKRSLKVYFDDSELAGLEVDFWIKFAQSGDIAIRPGQLRIKDKKQNYLPYLELNFVEDQLLNMNRKIYEAFQQGFEQFQIDPRVLSLERYKTIGEQLMHIQAEWERCKS